VYELVNWNGEYSPNVQTTIGDSESNRWIGSAAQDNQGNLAVQYNYVTDEKPVSIVYSGRLASDPPGSFRQERSLIDGTGVQQGFGWRWGEYSAMSVDPTDDCTFWITNAYYSLASQKFSDWGWLTRVGSFRFDECTSPPIGIISGTISNAATEKPIGDASIKVNEFSRWSISNGMYGPLRLPPGQYVLTASKPGYKDSTSSITITSGDTLTDDLSLEPIPSLSFVSSNVVSESCGIDRAIDPGEMVTIDLAFRNTGAASIASLNVQLLEGGGVIQPGASQNYGPMSSSGPTVSRQFSFSADPNLNCGETLTLTFALFDGNIPIGNHSVSISTGQPRLALREDFERTTLGGLPPRWTRQSFTTGGSPDPARSWRLSTDRSTSGNKSLFSPAPNQAGWNEIVSPIFKVNTSDARLTFQNWYELETTFLRNRLFDGSILEIKIGESDWQDIETAGGVFLSGGYDGAIDACCQNPFAGRRGWSGWSGINRPAEFITTEVRLPAAAAGNSAQLRWRVGTDIGTFREGQYIDDVAVTDGFRCHCN
jgi:hypothetical protein